MICEDTDRKGWHMIDWAHVADLYADFGEEGFSEVLQVFATEVQDGLAQLEAAQTPDEHQNAFHFLKGAALNLGFQQISMFCSMGEIRAARGEDFTLHKQQVIALFPQTCARLEQQWRQQLAMSA